MSLPNPLSADFLNVFRGQNPIYVNGKQIGYWTSSNVPCQGNAFIFSSITADPNWRSTYPPSKWMVRDEWWNLVSMGDFCVKNGIVPSWASVSDGVVSVPSPNTGLPATQYQQSNSGDLKPVETGGLLEGKAPIALGIGAAAILGLILVMRN